MTREELEEMSAAEVREHATTLGIEGVARETKAAIIGKILGDVAEGEEFERVSKAELARLRAGVAPELSPEERIKEFERRGKEEERRRPIPPIQGLYSLDGQKVKARLFKVTIFSTPQDSSDVPLICNGWNVVVKRNQEVILPEPFVEILRNAMIETVVQDPDSGQRLPQRILVYPHTAIPV